MKEPIIWPAGTREEIRNAITFISESLEIQNLTHLVEIMEEENPDCFSITCYDKDKYINFGLVGWDAAENRVFMAAYDQIRANHDSLEGVPEDDSKCWFVPQHVEHMIWHLSGRLRQLIAQYRARALAEEDETEETI